MVSMVGDCHDNQRLCFTDETTSRSQAGPIRARALGGAGLGHASAMYVHHCIWISMNRIEFHEPGLFCFCLQVRLGWAPNGHRTVMPRALTDRHSGQSRGSYWMC